MPSFSQAIAVADITDLKALAASNGDIRKVTQLDATYAYPDSYYIFRLGVSYTERLPGIVEDDAATGFWVMFPQPLALSSGDPTGSADLPGILWVNTTTGDRFISNPDLSWSAVAGGGGATSTTTTTSYTQPAVDSNVTVNVGDSSIFAVGQYVFVETGGNYKVISKPGATQLEIQNTGDTGNAVPSTSISSGSLVVPSGAFGDGTLSGTGATNRVGVWTTTDNIAGDDDLTFDSSTDTLAIAASGKLNFGAVPILDDSAGTTTLKNIDALDTTTRDVIRAAIDDGLTVAYHNTVSLNPAVIKTLYLLDTNSTAINVTLPSAPTDGSVIAFADYRQNFATNNVTVSRGGTDTIGDASATSRTLSTDGEAIKLVYWSGIWAIAQDSASGGGGATNLGYTASPTNGVVTSDTGTDATLTLADGTNAGLLAPADFTKLGYLTATGAVNLDNLGTAAFLDVGTSASQVVQLDGSARLPAVDGSQLTNLPAGFADPMTTAGDIIIRNGSNTTTRLGIGSEGQVLKVSSGVPAWAAESGGGGSGLTPVPVTNANSPYSANANELLLVDTTAGAVVINLPASGSDAIVQVSDVGGNAGTNSITINRAGSDTILGDTAMTITDDYASALLSIDSTQTDWKVAGFTLPNGGSGSALSNPVDTLYRSIQTVTYNDAGTSTMDNGTHDVFSLAANGTSTTIAHSNVPTTGNEYTFRLHLTWTSGSITWPTSWTKGMNAPTATGNYIIQGVTIDGGTSWTISVVYQ
jgi:hypothetical protein